MGETLKVCFLSPEFIPVYGGIGAYTVELLRHLPEDIEVHLVTVKREERNVKCGECKANENPIRKNLNTHFVTHRSDNFIFYFSFQQACLKLLPSLHKRLRFDLIHTQFPVMPDLLVQLLRRARVPSVCTVHSTVETQLASILRAQMGFLGLDAAERANITLFLPLKLCQYIFLRQVNYFIAVSDFIRKKMVESYSHLGEKWILTIPHGVDVRRFSPTTARSTCFTSLRGLEGPMVLFTARFVAKKGAHVLIKAIPKVLEHIPNVCFTFAGAGDFTPYLKQLRQENVPERSFKYLGYVHGDYLPDLYNLASVYAAPSFEDSLGIRILEAMSCGKPVVASQIGGVPEIISTGDNGILVPPGDSKKLADSIISLLEDADLRSRLAAAGRETVLTKFSSETMARKTAALYRSILSREADVKIVD